MVLVGQEMRVSLCIGVLFLPNRQFLIKVLSVYIITMVAAQVKRIALNAVVKEIWRNADMKNNIIIDNELVINALIIICTLIATLSTGYGFWFFTGLLLVFLMN